MLTTRSIKVEELKAIQLDILCFFDKFCRDNEINYSLACGTLLGAVRHKGYIPWDDDIDVYMLRDDYSKFIDLFDTCENGPYKLSWFPKIKEFDRVYANLYDSRTTLIEGRQHEFETGVFIDIFPLDDVPDNQKEWKKYKKKLFSYFWLRNIKVLRWSKKRNLGKNIFLYICKFLFFPLKLHSILSSMYSFIIQNNGKGYSHVYQSSYGIENENPLDKTLFYDIVDYEFEGKLFKGISNSDEYLKTLYGDYMQLPPVEKRVSTHSFQAYWKD